MSLYQKPGFVLTFCASRSCCGYRANQLCADRHPSSSCIFCLRRKSPTACIASCKTVSGCVRSSFSSSTSQLPYCYKRNLEIARALATNPKPLLLDEPAAGMNPNETEELMHTIHSVRDQFGVAILLIEHDMNFVMGICEEITVLDYGRVIARGDGKAIRNNPKVIAAYLGGD